MLALALVAAHHMVRDVRFADVRAAWDMLTVRHVLLALLFTGASYGALAVQELLAIRIIGGGIAWQTGMRASLIGNAIAHNLGMSLISGGVARLEAYRRSGLDNAGVARVLAMVSIAFWLGACTLFGLAVLAVPDVLRLTGLPVAAQYPRLVALAAVLPALGWIGLAVRGAPLRWRQLSLPVPRPGVAGLQVLIGVVDLALAGATLWILAPGTLALGHFLAVYSVAIVGGALANTPGGVGAFEAIMLLGAGPQKASLLSGILAYRLIYYLLPLGLAALALLRGRSAPRWARLLAPPALAGLVFAGGLVLLFSGAVPAISGRMHVLRAVLPLPFIEASHLAASIAGTVLLFLAGGLLRRTQGGFVLTRAVLLGGIVLSLLKGFDWEEALVLGIILSVLQANKAAFNRRSVVGMGRAAGVWALAPVAGVGLSIWLGFFAYREVPYQDRLWWEFASHGDASRFMRAAVATGMVALALALWRLIGPPRALPDTPVDRAIIARSIAGADRTDACLALTGDKRFLANAGGDAIIAWQQQGNSWIAMGDPIGPEPTWGDLAWRFRSAAFAVQRRAIFYQISLPMLPHVLDLGLQVVKIGEEARVDLKRFGLAGGHMRALRQADARLLREGAQLSIVAAADTPAIMDELAAISNDWLSARGHSEKHFSVGRFEPAYLARTDIAVVRVHGRAVAFANLWATADGSELSVDLMRHANDAPAGVMDFLFVQLMLRAQAAGYRWFALGMAPLSGLADRPLAPLWTRAGALAFRRGSSFYGFEGLRAYKAKFQPQWTPRYLACPRGTLAASLLDIGLLVSSNRSEAAAARRDADLPLAPFTGLASQRTIS